MNLPLTTPYANAATIVDATGTTVAECPDAETADIVIDIINTSAAAVNADSPAAVAALLALLARALREAEAV
jgi:hypothetical protein